MVEIVIPRLKAVHEDIVPLAAASWGGKEAKIAKEIITDQGHCRSKHNNAAGCCVTLVEEFMGSA